MTRRTAFFEKGLPLIKVVPGEVITGEVWFKKDGYNEHSASVAFGVYLYDSNRILLRWEECKPTFIGQIIDNLQPGEWHLMRGSFTVPLSHTPYNGSDGKGVRFMSPHIFILQYQNTPTEGYSHSMARFRLYRDANFPTDLSAKIISADGVVITDGGTVDGVDISTHTHDGTAIGGPKISYNDLVDKPTVDVTTHTHDGTAIGGPKIPLSNILPDGDINFEGKALTGIQQISFPHVDVWSDSTNSLYVGKEEGPSLEIKAEQSIVFNSGGRKFRFTNDVQPDVNGTWSLGSSARRWEHLYLYGNVVVNGLVDNLDVAAHTHNGTTVGGQKISYNDLKDKPSIPTALSQLSTDDENQRVSTAKIAEWDGKADGSIFTPAKAAEWDAKAKPPMPFRKDITISELKSGDYVALDILPEGRTSIMLTDIKVHTFTKSSDGWITPYFVADDKTEAEMIAIIDREDDKAINVLMSDTDLSTKNAIKNIKFKVKGTGTVSATLTCYGYMY